MKKLAVIMLALLLLSCAAAEPLEFDVYPDYTGEPAADSDGLIEDIMAANDVRANIEKYGALAKKMYVPDGDGMSLIREDTAACVDGVYVRRMIQNSAAEIYTAGDTAYMIENGAIYTMPAAAIPGIGAVDDFLFVYDESEYVCAVRDWENGRVALTRAGDTWLEYFLDNDSVICAIKTYEGAENPECSAYITVEACDAPDIPSFIIREAQK
jgi:hypothetical protein